MIQDLHSHTYYSFCGKDSPATIVEAAIAGGIELFGITDHNYGIGMCRKDARRAPLEIIPNEYDDFAMRRYYDHLSLIKEKYADRIRVLIGVEVATDLTAPKRALPDTADISFFDYCLIESLADKDSTSGGDLFAFAKRCGTTSVGIAHTNMFGFIKELGEDPYRYFKRMAEENIFWEMNVSYDSIHHYREHAGDSTRIGYKTQRRL